MSRLVIYIFIFVSGYARADDGYSCQYSLMPNVDKNFYEIRKTEDKDLIISHLALCAIYLTALERDGKIKNDPLACSKEQQVKACAHCTNLMNRISDLNLATTFEPHHLKHMKKAQQNLDEICKPLVSELHPKGQGSPLPQTTTSS